MSNVPSSHPNRIQTEPEKRRRVWPRRVILGLAAVMATAVVFDAVSGQLGVERWPAYALLLVTLCTLYACVQSVVLFLGSSRTQQTRRPSRLLSAMACLSLAAALIISGRWIASYPESVSYGGASFRISDDYTVTLVREHGREKLQWIRYPASVPPAKRTLFCVGQRPDWEFAGLGFVAFTEDATTSLSMPTAVRRIILPVKTLHVPYWLLIAPWLIIPACWALSWSGSRRREAAGLCSYCGYDLRATPDRCPECGRVTIPPATG